MATLMDDAMFGRGGFKPEELLVAWALFTSLSAPSRYWRVGRVTMQSEVRSDRIMEVRDAIINGRSIQCSDSFDATENTWLGYLCRELKTRGTGLEVFVEVRDPYDPDDPGVYLGVHVLSHINDSWLLNEALDLDLQDLFGEWLPLSQLDD
jgi:hypothetical protein